MSISVFNLFLAFFNPLLSEFLRLLDLFLQLQFTKTALVGLAVYAALFLARMFANPHFFARPFATDIGDFLPTLFHLFVATEEGNLFRFLALPGDLYRTFLLAR